MEHHTHAEMRRHSREEHGKRMHEIRRAGGGRTDEAQDARMIREGVHEHEGALHPGKPKTKLKLADGGCADGGRSHRRMDRARRAAGGRSGQMGKGKGSPEFWMCRVKPGRIMFELDGVPAELAKEAFDRGAAKLPMETRVVSRLGEGA